MSQRSIGVAVVGAGMAGRAHAAGYRNAPTLYGPQLPDVRLVAVADANEDLAADTARRYGYERSETSWQAVAGAADVDVVSVVLANPLHREVVEGLLAAGKHVLCEKPLAPSIADAEAMVAAAEGTGLQASVGFTFRRSPAIAAVRRLVAEGGVGAPVQLGVRYWCDYGVDPTGPMSWRYKGGPGSGALADIGSHVVDLAEFLCGPIESVRGAVLSTVVTERAVPVGTVVGHAAAELSDVREPVENEDVVSFNAVFASGATATLTASRVAFGHANSLGFDLFGTGRRRVVRPRPTRGDPRRGPSRLRPHPGLPHGADRPCPPVPLRGYADGLSRCRLRPERPVLLPVASLPGAGGRRRRPTSVSAAVRGPAQPASPPCRRRLRCGGRRRGESRQHPRPRHRLLRGPPR